MSLAVALLLPAISHADLIGYYPFLEGTGTTTADQSGHGNNGTFYNWYGANPVNGLTNYIFWTNSPFGSYCVGFAGNTGTGNNGSGGSYINCGNGPLFANLSGAFTLAAWVLPWQPTSGNNSRIVAKADGSGKRGWGIEFESPTGIGEGMMTPDCSSTFTVDTMPIAAGQWIHLAAVFNPADPSGPSLTIYTNGQMSSYAGSLPASDCTNNNGNQVYIGNRTGGATAMIGLIDHVRIYNNALAQSDIVVLPELAQWPIAFTAEPGVTIEPVKQTVRQYTNVSFSCSFTGSPPWFVQWYTNGVPIPGANSYSWSAGDVATSTCLITNVLPSFSGLNFSVSVSNLVYGIKSTNALLTVATSTNKPTISSVVALENPYEVLVKFDQPVDPNTSQNSANYVITNGVGSSIGVGGAVLGADGETVTLYTDQLTDGQTYYLNVNNVQDLDLNTIAAGTVVPFTYSTLLGFWQFAECSGTNTADSGYGGFTGTLVNGPTWTNSPFGHCCLKFNGVNQYVDVGNPVPLQLNGAMTLCAWAWPAAAAYSGAAGGRVVAKGDGPGSRGWFLSVESGPSQFHFAIAIDATQTADLLVPAPVTNAWVHLACVYDDSVPSITMYTNGVLAATMTDGVPPSQYDSGLDVEIGGRPPGAITPWNGMIDDVRIYGRALAQSEIQALPEVAQTPLGFSLQPASTSISPQAYVTFSETVTGAPPWFVQWYSNSVPISGANGQTLTIGPVQDTANGSVWTVQVSNLVYSVTSTGAVLSVSRDTTPPTVEKVTSFLPNLVTVLFSKPLDPASSQNAANYNITNGVGSRIAVSAATLGSDNETVTLTTATLTEGLTYYLNPNSIYDLAKIPNTVAPGTVVPFVYSSLAGWWRFEEGSGTNTADSSFDGATGTLVNGPNWTPSPFGHWCLSFNGLNQYVDVGDPPALQITGPLTLAAWVNPTSAALTDGGRVVAKEGPSGNRGYSLGIETDGNWLFHIAEGPTNEVILEVTNSTVAVGQWQHVAAVYDPNNVSGPSMFMYTNGVLGATLTTGVPASQVDSGLDVQIGNRPDGATPWAGLIDEVRIYTRALNNNEIAQLSAPIFLGMTLSNNQVTLNWAGVGQLQSAPAATGTYTNIIPAPAPPWRFTIVPGQNQKFFRLVIP